MDNVKITSMELMSFLDAKNLLKAIQVAFGFNEEGEEKAELCIIQTSQG